MIAYITLRSVKPFDKKPAVFSIGGFSFQTPDGTEFGFDWAQGETWTEVQDGYLVTESRMKDLDIETFDEEVYKDLGMHLWEITPEFLASCRITEVYYECFADTNEKEHIDLELAEFVLETVVYDTGEELTASFPKEAITDFNLMMEVERGEAITYFFKEE